MGTRTDPRFEAYLAKAPEFARPILEHLRRSVHDVCPEVRETLKWNFPAFLHRGKILCIIGVFKAHCRLNFWDSAVVLPAAHGADEEKNRRVLERLTRVADLPDDQTLRRYLEAAAEHAESGERVPERAAPRPRKAELPVPADFAALLKKNPAAKKTLASLPPSHRREYLAWIGAAKRAETRARRMATAVGWLAEGKRYDWKYQKTTT